MTELHETEARERRGLASASLWLGLFGLAFAVPPAAIFFFVPGFWVDGLNTTGAIAPMLGIAAVVAGAVSRRGAKRTQAQVGFWLGLLTLACSAAMVWRILSLLALEQ